MFPCRARYWFERNLNELAGRSNNGTAPLQATTFDINTRRKGQRGTPSGFLSRWSIKSSTVRCRVYDWLDRLAEACRIWDTASLVSAALAFMSTKFL